MVAQRHGQSFIVDAATTFDVAASFATVGMFNDITAGLVHCHLHRVDPMFVQVRGFSGAGDEFTDGGQVVVLAGKGKRL